MRHTRLTARARSSSALQPRRHVLATSSGRRTLTICPFPSPPHLVHLVLEHSPMRTLPTPITRRQGRQQDLCRMCHPAPAVVLPLARNLALPVVLRDAQVARFAPELRSFLDHGQCRPSVPCTLRKDVLKPVDVQDKWTPAQIDRMKAGGNAKCREFFEGNGQPWKSLPITEKVSPEPGPRFICIFARRPPSLTLALPAVQHSRRQHVSRKASR